MPRLVSFCAPEHEPKRLGKGEDDEDHAPDDRPIEGFKRIGDPCRSGDQDG